MAFGPCSPLAGLVVKHLFFLWSPGLSCPVPLCFSPKRWAKLRFVTSSSRPPVPFTLHCHFLIFPGDLLAPGRSDAEPETASFLGGVSLILVVFAASPARGTRLPSSLEWGGDGSSLPLPGKMGGEHGDLGEFGGFPGVFGGVWRFLGFSWSLGFWGRFVGVFWVLMEVLELSWGLGGVRGVFWGSEELLGCFLDCF